MTLTIGIIGAGRIGKVHAENLVNRIADAQVLAIADPVQAEAEQTAARLSIPTALADYRAVLSDPGIQAVVICSSTDTHARLIVEAAQAGKHIFCEKPIAFDLRAIDEALDAVASAGVKLQIGFNRRFDPNYARVRQAIASGEIGEPHLLRIVSRDPTPPPPAYVSVSGGMFLDMTIHDFDMARFLIGSDVTEVYTMAAVRIDPGIGAAGDVDTAVVMLRFANGVIGTIDNSRRAVYGYDQRVEVFGSQGMVHTENLYPNTAVISAGDCIRRDLPLHFFMERYTDSFIFEMRAFVEAVIKDEAVPVSGLDGRVPVAMALAARRSYDENRPVRLDEIGG